jgi:preprotein translocase subunit YajC
MVTNAALAILMVPRQSGSTGLIFFGEMALMVVIFYTLLIRPQTKERQRHEQMLRELKKGDEIITNGGIIGTVVHAEENRLTVKTGDNTRITVDRGRIAQVLNVRGGAKEE